MGTVWEIFEYSMDTVFGATMQKPMLNDPSGLTDTMWDLIVDAVGALVMSILGYGYIKASRNSSFLLRYIHSFISLNPQFFRKSFKSRRAKRRAGDSGNGGVTTTPGDRGDAI